MVEGVREQRALPPVKSVNPAQSGEAEQPVISQDLPPVDSRTIATSYVPADRILSNDEAMAFICSIIGKPVYIPAEEISIYLEEANRLANSISSDKLTEATRQRIESTPLLKQSLHWSFLDILTMSELEAPSIDPEIGIKPPLENMVSRIAADNTLDENVVKWLESGRMRLKIRSTQNKERRVNNFALMVEIGQYKEIVFESLDGVIIKGNSSEEEMLISRGVVTYLQRQLFAKGYLNDKFTEGIFCLNTLKAVQLFLNVNQLSATINVATASKIRDQREQEAEKAYQRYFSIQNSGSVSAYQRYEQAKTALDELSRATSYVNSYKDLPQDKLTREEKEFIGKCAELSKKYQGYVVTIFKDLFYPEEKGLFDQIEIEVMSANKGTLETTRSDLSLAQQLNNTNEARDLKKKEVDEYNNYIDSIKTLLATLRGWKTLVKGIDIGLTQTIEKTIDQLAIPLAQKEELDVPDEAIKVDSEFYTLDEQVITDLDSSREASAASPVLLIKRYDLAAGISDRLGTNPARSFILSQVYRQLRDKKASTLSMVLNSTQSLMGFSASLERMIAGGYATHIQYQLTGVRKQSAVAAAIAQYLSSATSYGEYGEKLQGEVENLLFSLYGFNLAHNRLADSNKEDKIERVSFSEMLRLYFTLMKEVKALNDKKVPEDEIRKILGILVNTSNDAEIAREELAQKQDSELDTLTFKDSKLRGAVSLVLTPRALGKLRKEAGENVRLVTYEYLKRLIEAGDKKSAGWIKDHLPKGGEPAAKDLFVMSKLGIYPVPVELQSTFPPVQENWLEGKILERTTGEFIDIEPAANINLALGLYGQATDKEYVEANGTPSDRIGAVSLKEVSRVFGESKYWVLTYIPATQLEPKTLIMAAGLMENPEFTGLKVSADLPSLLRKIASSSAELAISKTEYQTLLAFMKEIKKDNYEAYISLFSTLTEEERADLKRALVVLEISLNQVQHKEGLNEREQADLKELARLFSLNPQLYIKGDRFVSDEPPQEIIEILSQRFGNSFDREGFVSLYQRNINVLRKINRGLRTLSSKYEPEGPGWQGPEALIKHHYKKIVKSGVEVVNPVSQADYLTAGVPSDLNFVVNLVVELRRNTPRVQRLKVINGQIAELEKQAQASLAGLYQSLPDEDLSVGSNELKAKIDKIILAYKNNEQFKKGLQTLLLKKTLSDKSPSRPYINAFVNILERIEGLKTEPKEAVFQADSLLDQVRLNKLHIANTLNVETNEEARAAMRQILVSLDEIEQSLVDLITQRKMSFPAYVEKARLETEAQQIVDAIGSDRLDREKYLALKEIFPQLFDPEERSVVTDTVVGTLQGTPRTVVGPDGDTDKSAAKFIADYFDKYPEAEILLGNLYPVPGASDELNAVKAALSERYMALQAQEQKLSGAKSLAMGLSIVLSIAAKRYPLVRQYISSHINPTYVVGGIHGLMDIKTVYTPETLEELVENSNSSWSRIWQAGKTWIGNSTNRNPETNLSPQVYSLIAGTKKGQRALRGSLQQNGNIPLSFVNREVMLAFLDYAKQEILPNLQHASFRQDLAKMMAAGKMPMDLTEPGLAEKMEGLINDPRLPKSYQVFDAFHAPETQGLMAESVPTIVELSRFVEAISIASGKINESQLAENIELYPMTYYDPIEARNRQWLAFSAIDGDRRMIPKEKIGTLHFNENNEKGEISQKWLAMPGDMLDWSRLYLPSFISGAGRSFINHPLKFIGGVGDSMLGSFSLFSFLMAPQIGGGLSDTAAEGIRGLKNGMGYGMAWLNGDNTDYSRFLWLQSVEKTSEGTARTTGEFFFFEVLKPLLYGGVLNKIEDRDYDGAIGEALGITLSNYGLLRLYRRIKNGPAKEPKEQIPETKTEKGRLGKIKNNRLYKLVAKEAAAVKHKIVTRQGTGIKLMAWQTLDPIIKMADKLEDMVAKRTGSAEPAPAAAPAPIEPSKPSFTVNDRRHHAQPPEAEPVKPAVEEAPVTKGAISPEAVRAARIQSKIIADITNSKNGGKPTLVTDETTNGSNGAGNGKTAKPAKVIVDIPAVTPEPKVTTESAKPKPPSNAGFVRADAFSGWLLGDKGKAFLKTADGKKFAQQYLEHSKGTQIVKSGVLGLVTSLVSCLGAQEAADALGITNPTARAAFILGIAHTSGVATGRLTQGKAPKTVRGDFSLNLIKGFGEMQVAGAAYDLLLQAAGVSERSALRGETAKLVASSAIPDVTHAAYQLALNKSGETAGLRLAGFAGRALGVIGVTAWTAETLNSLLTGEYNMTVEAEVARKMRADEGRSLADYPLASLFSGVRDKHLTSKAAKTPYGQKVIRETLEAHRMQSLVMRKDVADYYAAKVAHARSEEEAARIMEIYLGEKVDLGEFEAEELKMVRFRDDYSPMVQKRNVSGEKMYEFLMNYIQEHKTEKIDDSVLIDVLKKEFGLVSTEQQVKTFLKMAERKMMQEQIAALYKLDPDSYNYISISAAPKDRLNQDIRDQFDDQGRLQQGQALSFVRWIKAASN